MVELDPEGSLSADPLIGGRYRLVRKLGSGGMGDVWQARDERDDMDVAVKEVRLGPFLAEAHRAERLARAWREAQHASRLVDHPNIITILDVVEDDDRPWIVMELIHSRTLVQLIGEYGRISPVEAARIGLPVLEALAACHGAGIFHRDVKPSNILLAYDGRVVLTDFGIATQESDFTLTPSGMALGSPEFMSPERAQGQDATEASDLFSLGATLYYAIAGASPFRRDSIIATATAVLFDEPEWPQHAGPLAILLFGLLRKDPRLRVKVSRTREILTEITAAAGTESPLAADIVGDQKFRQLELDLSQLIHQSGAVPLR